MDDLESTQNRINEKLMQQFKYIMNGTPPQRQQQQQQQQIASKPIPIYISFGAKREGLFTFGQQTLFQSQSVVHPQPSKIPRKIHRAQLYKDKYKRSSTFIYNRIRMQQKQLQGVRLNRRFDVLMAFRMKKNAEEAEMEKLKRF